MKHILVITITCLLCISCNKDVYHDFTEEEKAFLVYNEGDVFKLKNESTGEIIELTVTERYIRYVKDSPSGMSISTKTHYEHEGRVEFSRDDPDDSGYIYIYKDKIDQYITNVSFRIENKGYGDGDGSFTLTNITANGINYNNIREYIAGNNSKMYYSLEYGIVKLENLDNGVTHVRVP